MAKRRLDALLVSNVVNVSYLSGFTGEDTVLMILPDSAYLITDFRYVEQAQQEAPHFALVRHKKGFYQKAIEVARRRKVKRLGVEGSALSHSSFLNMRKEAKRMRLLPQKPLVEDLRMIKDAEEISLIRAAAACAAKAFKETVGRVKPGMTEFEVATDLEFRLRRLGARRGAFETIVAVNERASLPHARAGEKQVEKTCLLLIDFGAYKDMYNCDCTRTMLRGRPTAKMERIYRIVEDAQRMALETIKPGLAVRLLDKIARDHIKSKGFGKEFGHSLGHGIGREVHESPRISWKTSKIKLQEGMVFTVEPGIYLPNVGGVRIEDTVVVTKKGCEVLTTGVPKESH